MHALHVLTMVAALTAVAASCPERNAITNFNIEAFLGGWFEVLRMPNTYEKDYSCMADHYYHGENGIVLYSHAYNTSKGEYDILDAAVEMAPGDIGQYELKTRNQSAWNSTYWILGTDYTNYMVVAGCLHGVDTEDAAMWVLVRDLPMKEEILPNIDQILAENNLSREQMEAVSHQFCPLPPGSDRNLVEEYMNIRD